MTFRFKRKKLFHKPLCVSRTGNVPDGGFLKICQVSARSSTALDRQNGMDLLAPCRDKVDLALETLLYLLHQGRPVVVGITSPAVFDSDFQHGIAGYSRIPQSLLAARCFSGRLTRREIMIRWAWGEPAPCMDSVR